MRKILKNFVDLAGAWSPVKFSDFTGYSNKSKNDFFILFIFEIISDKFEKLKNPIINKQYE